MYNKIKCLIVSRRFCLKLSILILFYMENNFFYKNLRNEVK